MILVHVAVERNIRNAAGKMINAQFTVHNSQLKD
ncbi:MAG: hypothetical protein TIS_02706 [Tissierella sp.]